ncbi:lipopolysaccharide biosynthesis protein [Hallella multisaccharivorax]|uniref:lipopolysaccharide biosynthesis protein n=1 Tax=Hallella multisaccharivorax TaxID=310514 RepID=UPI0036075672
MNLKNIIKTFHSSDKRNSNLRNNILLSGAMKATGMLTSFLIVPVTLHYLDNEIYGIWMTITSILMWFSFFDVGLGNGMRNYMTQAISANNYNTARAYLSTTLCVLTLIAIGIGLLCIPFLFLNFNKIFNTYALPNEILRNALIIAVLFTLANFVAKNIGFVFIALQKYGLNDVLTTAGSVLGLITVFILTKTTKSNLLYVVTAFTLSPVVVYIIAAIPIFHKYKQLRPSWRYYDKQLLKNIVSKGLGFFAIQITSCLVIFGGSNVIISHFCGPASVTVYNIAYKLFNLLAIAYTVIISPMWNAYTDAQVRGDYTWIRATFYKALKLWGLSVIGGLMLLVICNIFYKVWVGASVTVPIQISVAVLLYISAFNFNNCVTYLLNGLNKITVQIITSVAGTILYLLFIILLGGKIGMKGIILSMAVCYILMGTVHLYQCRLLIGKKAKGIWNK